MSEREKEIMTTIIEGFSKISEFEKGYLLGIVEGKVNEKERNINDEVGVLETT